MRTFAYLERRGRGRCEKNAKLRQLLLLPSFSQQVLAGVGVLRLQQNEPVFSSSVSIVNILVMI